MKKATYCAIVCAVLIIGAFSLYFGEKASQPPITSQVARDFIAQFSALGSYDTPRKSCGVFIPEDFPVEYLTVNAWGRTDAAGEVRDLLPSQTFHPGEWLIFEDLQTYSEAYAEFLFIYDGVTLASQKINLLTCEKS